MKKNILITNDDGYSAIGLKILITALEPIANITVVAPASNKSACAHSMTLTRPMNFVEYNKNQYFLDDGTPTDCIFLGLKKFFNESNKPDLIVSGINIGSNMGEDITYSGTVAGAMEGVLQGIPSIAISQVVDFQTFTDEYDFSLAKKIILEIVLKIFQGGFPLKERKLLNINIPNCTPEQYQGYAITKAGYRIYGNDCKINTDPRGNEYFWIGLHPLKWIDNDGHSDFEAIQNNKTSITPIKLDLTSYQEIVILEQWIKN